MEYFENLYFPILQTIEEMNYITLHDLPNLRGYKQFEYLSNKQ